MKMITLREFGLVALVLAVLAGSSLSAAEPQGMSMETYRKINTKVSDIKANPRQARVILKDLKKLVDANRAELLKALSKGQPLERALAARVLHLTTKDHQKVATALEKMVGDEDIETRRAVVNSLARLKKASSADALLKALADVDDTVRISAVSGLGFLKIAKTQAALTKATGDSNYRVRLGACRALGALANKENGPEIIAGIKDLLDDENAYVRMSAAAIIRKLSGEKKDSTKSKVANGKPEKKEENILHEMASEMEEIKENLEAEHHGREVVTAQEEVTKKLDQLIKQIQKQQQQQQQQQQKKQKSGKKKKKDGKKKKGGSKPGNQGKKAGNNPSSPATSEFMTSGQKQHGAKGELGEIGAAWGNLPPKLREKMLQVSSSDLPERYRKMLEIYFMSIAESKD